GAPDGLHSLDADVTPYFSDHIAVAFSSLPVHTCALPPLGQGPGGKKKRRLAAQLPKRMPPIATCYKFEPVQDILISTEISLPDDRTRCVSSSKRANGALRGATCPNLGRFDNEYDQNGFRWVLTRDGHLWQPWSRNCLTSTYDSKSIYGTFYQETACSLDADDQRFLLLGDGSIKNVRTDLCLHLQHHRRVPYRNPQTGFYNADESSPLVDADNIVVGGPCGGWPAYHPCKGICGGKVADHGGTTAELAWQAMGQLTLQHELLGGKGYLASRHWDGSLPAVGPLPANNIPSWMEGPALRMPPQGTDAKFSRIWFWKPAGDDNTSAIDRNGGISTAVQITDDGYASTKTTSGNQGRGCFYFGTSLEVRDCKYEQNQKWLIQDDGIVKSSSGGVCLMVDRGPGASMLNGRLNASIHKLRITQECSGADKLKWSRLSGDAPTDNSKPADQLAE
ncbi:RICIN domain-containing protein, partial [Streptomyces lavendulocolor]|uniref:RICIN domain-containing protein n=1 Tax=Streptomyces lavendulocolor TaxID=67316 RepID=UPI0033ED31F9